jgi:hypothetical protein
MGNGVVAESEWDRLDRLQRSLLCAAAAQGAPGAAGAGRGVRLRLARLALEEVIRTDAEEGARRRREEFEGAVAALERRVARRALLSPPPPLPPAVLAVAAAPATPAPVPAPLRRKAAASAAPPTAPVRRPTLPVPAGAAGSAPTPPAAQRRRARPPKPVPAALPAFWTPGIVLGFRMWEVRARLQGAWKPWDSPEHEARCLSRRTGPDAADVPHTDGRCGPPSCGLYCFKEPEQLVAAFGLPRGADRWVMGLVSLSGKVVEHERGYRAQKARVLAAAVVGRGQMIRIEGDARLQALFAHPEGTISGLLSADPGVVEAAGDAVRMMEAVTSYLALVRDFHESGGG